MSNGWWRWFRVAAYGLVVVMGSWGFWRVEQVQHNQCEAIDRLVVLMGEEAEADSARVEAFIDRLHEDLDGC